MAVYKVFGISVSGTPAVPDTILFNTLYDSAGNALPTFSSKPAVIIQKRNKDCKVYLTSDPTTTEFYVACSNVGDLDRPILINIVIITDLRPYLKTLPAITGTPAAPQTITYASLGTFDDLGVVPSSYSTPPAIIIQSYNKDCNAYLTEAPGTSSFKIARSNVGDSSGSLLISVYLISTAPSIFTSTGIIRTTSVTITGTIGVPQQILYSTLTDTQGATIDTTYTDNPIAIPQSIVGDNDVFISENPNATYFKVAKSNYGDLGTITCTFLMFVSVTAVTADFNITFEDMISMMGIVIRDPIHRDCTIKLKALLLNDAMNRLVRDLKGWVVPELDVTALSQTVTSGVLALSSLTTAIFDGSNGIESIKVSGDNGYRCFKISLDEYMRFNDLNVTFTATKPKYYIRGSSLYFLPTSITAVDIYYKKNIAKMIFNTSDLVNTDLVAKFHTIIIGLACEMYIGRTNEAKLLYESALVKIEEIKMQSIPTDTIIFNRVNEDEELQYSDTLDYNITVDWSNVI